MFGRGAAISEKVADGVRGNASRTHRKLRVHLGHFQIDAPSSLRSLASFSRVAVFCLMFLAAGDTDMSVFARFGCASASIPPTTDLDIWVKMVGSRSLHCGSRLSSGGGLTLMTLWCVTRLPNQLCWLSYKYWRVLNGGEWHGQAGCYGHAVRCQ